MGSSHFRPSISSPINQEPYREETMLNKDGSRSWSGALAGIAGLVLSLTFSAVAQEAANIYGVHDVAPSPQEYLDHINNGGAKGWVTATFAIGANPNDFSGADLTGIA